MLPSRSLNAQGARPARRFIGALILALVLVPLGTAVAATVGASASLSMGDASASSSPPGPSPSAASAPAVAAVSGVDLTITKTDSADPVVLGAQFNYTLTVTNQGDARANGVTVSDVLPTGVSYVSSAASSGTCTYAVGTRTVTCRPASNRLEAGATATFTITVQAATAGTVTNTATATTTSTDVNSANDADSETTTIRTAAPTGLTCTANPSGVQLDWNDVTQATGYNVYRRTGESGDFVLLTATTASQHLDTTAAVGQSYQYRVTSTSAGGESAASGTCTVASVPEFPTILAGAVAVAGCLGAMHVWRRR